MLTITVQVNAPDGSAQAVKEVLAMHLERFGDTRVLSIIEEIPQQMGFDTNTSFSKDNHYGGKQIDHRYNSEIPPHGLHKRTAK